jgi:hypothetical protein
MRERKIVFMKRIIKSVSVIGSCVVLLIGLSMLFPTTSPGADKVAKPMVKGSLKMGKATVAFNSAVAYRINPKGAAKGEEWRVVHLSDKPFDNKAVKAELKKNGRYSNFENQVQLTINPKGEIHFLYIYVKEDNVNLSTPPIGVTGQVSLTKDRATGRVYMPKPMKNFDDEYQFDVTFDAEIITY